MTEPFTNLPTIHTDRYKDYFTDPERNKSVLLKLTHARQLRSSIEERWHQYQSDLVSAVHSWEAFKANQIDCQKAQTSRKVAQANSELDRVLKQANDVQTANNKAGGKIETEIADSFNQTWGNIAPTIFDAKDKPQLEFVYDPAKGEPCDEGRITLWRSDSATWRGQCARYPMFVNDVTTRLLPASIALLAAISTLALLVHPSPGFGAALALPISALAAFLNWKTVTFARTRARRAFKMAASIANDAVSEVHNTRRKLVQELNHKIANARTQHADIVSSAQNSLNAAISSIQREDGQFYSRLKDALHNTAQGISHIDGQILTLVEAERLSCDRIASDLNKNCKLRIDTVISPSEHLHLRLGGTEHSALRWSLSGVNLPNVSVTSELVSRDLFIPYVWGTANKQALVFFDIHPAADAFEALVDAAAIRLMRQVPGGKLTFVLIDPIGLGRTFSTILSLADDDDSLISKRVWSDREHIRRQLKDLIEHIETVIQRYLRSDFEDIDKYNEDAGEIAEPYRFLFIADFPNNFDDESFKDLIRILQNGPRCGVYSVIHINCSVKSQFALDLTRFDGITTRATRVAGCNSYRIADVSVVGETTLRDAILTLDDRPQPELARQVVAAFGQATLLENNVEFPYEKMFYRKGVWSESSADRILCPLGPSGAKRIQHLELGRGTAHHALIVGRPGSGKSNLIHVVITAMARFYSPAELQMYLIDFKKGVEFKPYAECQLPHARVIAIESEREFGVNVLHALDAELTKRGEFFRESGSSSIADCRAKTARKLPRIVLVIDEFQELFNVDDKIKRDSSILIDRLVRQGRAFGIHLILATQSLANAGLERSTQDQMAVRIALQCSESDSRLILAQDNIAARRLTRPGEAIFNDAVGLVEGNKPFQIAFFSEDDRRRSLELVENEMRKQGLSNDEIIIFEGHHNARIEAARGLLDVLDGVTPSRPKSIQLILGEPIALQGTQSFDMRRLAGHNLLALTRNEDEARGLMYGALLSAVGGTDANSCSFVILDFSDSDEEGTFSEFTANSSHCVNLCDRRSSTSTISSISGEIDKRQSSPTAKPPSLLLILFGLHRARELRDSRGGTFGADRATEPSPARTFAKILRDGPVVGVHTLIWCDTFANFDRTIERGTLKDIVYRVAGPLSSQDSQHIFGDYIASSLNRPHRLVAFNDEKVGQFDLFRPFGSPDAGVLKTLLERVHNRREILERQEPLHE